MLDEQTIPPAGGEETHSTAETAETAETSEASQEPVEVTESNHAWNGEIPSLSDQDWFKGIEQDELKAKFLKGYEEVRNNMTAALHKHTTAQSAVTKQLQATHDEVRSKQTRLAELIGQLEVSATEDTDAAEKLKALESGYKAQFSEFESKLAQASRAAQQYHQDNTLLARKIQELQGREEGIRARLQGQLEEYVAQEREKAEKFRQEAEGLRQANEQYEAERAVAMFEGAFPYLKGDSERARPAMNLYFGLMQGMLKGNPDADDAMVKEMDAFIEARVKAKFPEHNPAATAPPKAETLASPPAQTGTAVDFDKGLPSNKISIF